MTYRIKHQKNNSSGIPGLRLRHRYTQTGLVRYFIDVTWSDQGRRRCSSIPCRPETYLDDTKRALELRQEKTQAEIYSISPRKAFALLSKPYVGADS